MRMLYTNNARTSQRLLLAVIVAFAAILVSVPSTPFATMKANAASIGTGSCVSTVDNATGVTSAVASNGDCVVTFATAATTGTDTSAAVARTWTVPSMITSVSVLVVAGGGGGGSSNNCCLSGGGGGGGGVVVATNFAVTPGASIAVSTGLGGNGANCNNGSFGGNSAFGSLLAIGGGRGQGCFSSSNPGGSGGGAHYNTNGGESTQSTQGTASGTNVLAYGNVGGGSESSNWGNAGGGGGGAGQAGGTGTSSTGGNGGEGIGNAFRTGTSIIYGSGGGGQGRSVQGVGGTNAGDANGTSALGGVGINGVNETGAGGGGGWQDGASNQSAGRGGTGVVVVRYSLPVLAQPTNVQVVPTPGVAKSINVSWDAVPNAVTYRISVRGTGCGAEYGNKTGITGTSTTVTSQNMTSYLMPSGAQYKITVSAIGDGVNYASSVGAQCVLVTTNAYGALPTITTSPTSLNKTTGQSASFLAAATTTDAGVLSYQWSKDGTAITGATSNSYDINSVTTTNAGSYAVTVFNTLNGVAISTTSSSATLTVAS